jgi:hypothetical protein
VSSGAGAGAVGPRACCAMTYLQLLPHVSFAVVGDRAIFLDLRRDRYCALEGGAAAAFDTIRSSPDCEPCETDAETLLATGMFARSKAPCELLPARIAAPETSLAEDLARPRSVDLLHVLLLVARSRRSVRSEPIEKMIASRRGRGAGPGSPECRPSTLELAKRFQRARALIPIRPVCLQDSLALHDWLAAHGASAALVLGVQLEPFAAHSWVQLGTTVLNEAPDQVAAYTPILVVE